MPQLGSCSTASVTQWDKRDADHLMLGLAETDDVYFGGTTSGGKRGRGTDKAKVMAAVSLNEKGNPKFLKMQVGPIAPQKT